MAIIQHIGGKTGAPAYRMKKEELLRNAQRKNKPQLLHSQREKTFWARLSVVSNGSLLMLKLLVGIYIMSISVISEGLHTGIDLIAALMAAYAVHKAVQPADKEHKYGHGKYENLSGTLEAILIFAVGLIIIYGAVSKIFEGVKPIEVDLGIIVMLISVVVNLVVSRKLLEVHRRYDSVAIEADAYHLSADVWTSFGVLGGLVAIWVGGDIFRIPNIAYIDPVIAIVIAALIIKVSWDLTKRSIPGLLDGSLPENEEKIIHSIIKRQYSKFVDYHDFRSRKAGAERHLDLHLVVAKGITVEKAHMICDALEKEIESRLPLTKVIIHCEPCDEKCAECKFEADRNGECREEKKRKKDS
jgi:cation diffusion facilitator family transporter